MGKFNDLTGQKYGRLTAVKIIGISSREAKTRTTWLFKCDCGAEIILNENAVRTGNTKSCGCLRKESAAAKSELANRLSQIACYTHKHTGTRIYKIFKGMKQRCCNPHNPNYKYYGGKGVSICQEWINDPLTFINWAMDHGYDENLTIDRIESDKGYCPDNCEFITQAEQARKAVKERLKNIERLAHAAS